MQYIGDLEQYIEHIDQSLDEIEYTLEQMLSMAQLSASDMNMDRQELQKIFERLKDKIDLIADNL